MAMKYVRIAFVLLGLASCTGDKEGQVRKTANVNRIEAGIADSLYSNVLGEERKFWIFIPNTFNQPLFTGQKSYPVAYLLDGETHFRSFTGMLDHLTEQNGNMICPEMMVVGILSTHRNRDFTPSRDTVAEEESGGSERFTEFLQRELIPYINAHYHPQPFRMLVGHSYGGLFVMQTLVHHASLFNAYAALDPSLSWDKNKVLREADTLMPKTDFYNRYLFVAIANTMSIDMNLQRVKEDTAPEHNHIRANLNMVDHLQQKPHPRLNWDYNYYEDEDHFSVTLRGAYDALHYIFRDYPFTAYPALFDNSVPADSALHIVINHFRYASSRAGVELKPSEHFLNALGYSLLEAGANEKAYAFFKLNIDTYPASSNVYDSMGDYYAAIGNTAQAELYYDKAKKLAAN